MSPLPTNQSSINSSPAPSTAEAEWESRMAHLVGLEGSPTSDKSSTSLAPPDIQETKTKQPISSNPFAKLGLVGIATFAVVIFAGGFLSQIMSNGKQKPQQIAPIQEKIRSPNQPRAQQLEDEVETLKTKLALSEQAQAVKAAQQQLRRVRSSPTPEVATKLTQEPRRDSTPALPKPTPVVKTLYVPKVVEVERVVKVPQVVEKVVRPQPVVKNTAPPLQTTFIRPPLPPTQPPAAIAPVSTVEIEPPPSPLEEWSRLAKLGSYGAVTSNQNRANPTASRPERPADVATKPKPPRRTTPYQQETPDQATPSVSQTPRNGKSTVVGSSAKAVLATALFGETTKTAKNDQSDSDNVFVVRLKQPLKTADGDVALAAGSELLTQVSSISENGLVQLEINKVMMPKDDKLTQRTIPKNALAIRASKGKPLIANQFPNQSGSIATMDAGLFVLGGIGKAAELFNRVEQRVVLRDDDNYREYDYPDPNIAAGVLEGGLKSVVPSISRRNQRAISEMMRRSNVWFLPAGKEVEIYVNQEIQF